MKILYVTTIGGTMDFFQKFIEELVQEGHTVDIACNDSISLVPDFYNELGCKVYSIQTSRSPLNKGNLIAIKQLKKLVEEKKYDIVHCHTPIAAMCTRIACRTARKNGTKVFYTAHGFHFYKGAPLKNWLLYYPVEKICSYFTDVLITINKEDYTLAQAKMKAKRIEYVPGVGIDLEKFGKITIDKSLKCQELGIPENMKLLLSVGELNENKNHETVIRAIADLKDVYYLIAGNGSLQNHLENVIKECGLAQRVKLLGYRSDVGELCEAADVFVFPSFREGLSVSVMEAMASGLPCVVSNIRGNTDLIDANGGVLFDPHSVKECQKAVVNLLKSDMEKMGNYNLKKIKKFSIETVNEQMNKIVRGGYYHLDELIKRQGKRNEMSIPQDAIWILNVGELILRKNQEILIRAVANMENIYLTIAGQGPLMESLKELIKDLGIADRVKLLGFRSDISELCSSCDIFAFSSFHEGLPVSVMEAMAGGLPIVCSRIRGNIDLVDENGGMMFNPHCVQECQNAIEILLDSDLKKFGAYNMERIKEFEISNVNEIMRRLYIEVK